MRICPITAKLPTTVKPPRALLAALCLLPAGLAAAPPQYHVTVLNGLGGSYSIATGVNNSGQVVGYSYLPGNNGRHAVRWTGSTPTAMDDLGGNTGIGYSINDSGEVTGQMANYAARWTGTTPTDLGGPPDGETRGHGINASGQIAGVSGDPSGVHAVRWTDTAPLELGRGEYSSSYGRGINASGQTVGIIGLSSGGPWRAARWTEANPTFLPSLDTANVMTTVAYGINVSGQVCGYSGLPSGLVFHAVRWSDTVTGDFNIDDLGTLGGSNSWGVAINISGDVVGMAETADGDLTIFLHTGETMYKLKDLLLPGSGVNHPRVGGDGVNCLNDFGQIAVWDDYPRALLLTPITPGWPDGDADGLRDAWELDSWGTTIGHTALDDFDHDGIPELLEMAFGLDPKKPDAAALPQPVVEDGYLTITLTKYPGVTYEVQSAAAPDAPAFSPATTTVLLDNAAMLKVRDNFPIATNPARWMRGKVTTAP